MRRGAPPLRRPSRSRRPASAGSRSSSLLKHADAVRHARKSSRGPSASTGRRPAAASSTRRSSCRGSDPCAEGGHELRAAAVELEIDGIIDRPLHRNFGDAVDRVGMIETRSASCRRGRAFSVPPACVASSPMPVSESPSARCRSVRGTSRSDASSAPVNSSSSHGTRSRGSSRAGRSHGRARRRRAEGRDGSRATSPGTKKAAFDAVTVEQVEQAPDAGARAEERAAPSGRETRGLVCSSGSTDSGDSASTSTVKQKALRRCLSAIHSGAWRGSTGCDGHDGSLHSGFFLA